MLKINNNIKAIKDNAMTSAKPCVDAGRCFIWRGMGIGKLGDADKKMILQEYALSYNSHLHM